MWGFMNKEMKDRLKKLVEESRTALVQLSEETSVQNQNMLRYMIGKVEAALRGEPAVPVSGSRAFLEMDESAWAEFAYSHYAMFGFEREEDGTELWGLRQALDWFRGSAGERVESSCFSGGEAPQDGEGGKSEKEPEFFFEKKKKDYLLFSEEEWESIRERIGQPGPAGAQYDKIKAIANRTGTDEMERLWKITEDGALLPDGEELYSDTAKGITFRTPSGVSEARLRFVFPDGCGQDWKVRGIRVAGASGREWKAEEELFLRSDGKERVRQLQKSFPVEPESMYTLHFQVNQRRKLSHGIKIEVCYEEENGKQGWYPVREYNRKAWYPAIFLNLDMQCSAVCHAVTGEREYARRAFLQMLLFLDDFCQGALYWMRHNSRPEGRDNYGAVQAGRNLSAVAMTWAMIRDAEGASSEEERERFVKLAEFVLNDVLDLRDRTCLTPWRAQRGTGNWQTDMCIGAAMLAAAVEEIPYRKQWIRNAEAVLSAQLSCNLNPDGSWPESLRYHHATLEHFCTFARFWEHETGEDWFSRNHLDKMFAYSVGVQLPPYVYFQNRICTPSFGDHKLGDGGEYQILGAWSEKVSQKNRALAAQMRETWELAGCPVKEPAGEAVVAELLLTPGSDSRTLPEIPQAYRAESRAFPDAGIYLFRRQEQKACLAVMCSPKKIGHGHLDQGSFLYYYRNVPLVMDSGIEGYFDATTQWHISSLSHACMLFAAGPERREEETEINLSAGDFSLKRGWSDTPEASELLEYHMGEGKESIRMRIENPAGKGWQIRTLTLDERAALRVTDEVFSFEGEILFSLPILAKDVSLTMKEEGRGGVHVLGTGYYGVDFELTAHRPVRKAWIEYGRVTPMHPGKESMIPYLRLTADAKTGFDCLIRGKIRD